MFNIVTIGTPNNEPTILLDVNKKSVGTVSPLGPQGSRYILALPSIGYMALTDVGPSVSGPGDWDVKVSNTPHNWSYRGGGAANISVEASGEFTISGGANTVKGKLVPWDF